MRNHSASRFVVLFAVVMLASYLHGNAIRWDCFEVVSGYVPHIVCTLEGFTAIDFAVDRYGDGGWKVVMHSASSSNLYLKEAENGEVIHNGSVHRNYTVEGSGEYFYFAFAWDCDSNGKDGYHGWLQMSTEDGDLLVADSAIYVARGGTIIVGESIPEPSGELLALIGSAILLLRRK